jgi:hypothetical protein
MLGRFLEISVHAPVVRDAVAFYERLGLTQAVTNDIWPLHYGVLTDGRVALGIHAYDFPSPSLTWVRPGLAAHLSEYIDAGIEFEFQKTGEEVFNEVGFRDPDGQMATILEARTYSPPSIPLTPPLIGYFREYRYPVRSTAASAAFWEPLGFVAMREDEDPETESPVVLTSDGIDLSVYRAAPQPPQFVFDSTDLQAAEGLLEQRGFGPRRTRDAITGRDGLEVTAPEGSRLLVLEENL